MSARAILLASLLAVPALAADAPKTLPDERPAAFTPAETGFDYTRRDAMIPMRDGVKLHVVIMVPKGAAHMPILLTRTPYNADELMSHRLSSHMLAMLDGYDNADDIEAGEFIRVYGDVRGKYKSEGAYVMNRPWRGPLNGTEVDHPTDTYDTIDWLVKNIPESNGKVGTIGISYNGFTALMSLIHPHPALKCAVPMNPMVDGWMGDDWFHRGAFRQVNLSYIYEQEATRAIDLKWWETHYDDYDMYLAGVSAGAIARAHGMDQLGFWQKIATHPAYDAWWQDQAVDKKLAAEGVGVPTLLVHSLYDQEDIYGAIAVWKALKPKDTNNLVRLVMGPWHHGQEIFQASRLGAIDWDSDTGKKFRYAILRPFLDHYLKDAAPPLNLAPVTAFETGTNQWLALPAWPAGCMNGCRTSAQKLYLRPDASLGLGDAGTASATLDYVSDPAHPIPYHQRPIHYEEVMGNFWQSWLADDQREASTRTDVLTFTTPPLTEPLKIAGEPVADLHATTTGTDGDFVVKLIDVYPDEVPLRPEMSGYQLMIAADILRGRYRNDYAKPSPIPAGQMQHYRFPLPTANHVFLPGHRVMVQVQSSWFPLYDRNPQTYVDNIMFAKPGDYRRATIGLAAGGAEGSFVELPVVRPE